MFTKENIKGIALNVRGLNAYEKRNTLYEWFNDNNVDVIFLQETHFCEKKSF